MTRRRTTTCDHPPMRTFIAFEGKGGARVWRCSHCGREDVWRDGWEFYGSYECLVCSAPRVLAVTCSDACRAAFTPTDPSLALELARPRGFRVALP